MEPGGREANNLADDTLRRDEKRAAALRIGRQLEGDGVEWQQSDLPSHPPSWERRGSNPIESSEPSISDPSRRVKGKELKKKGGIKNKGEVGGFRRWRRRPRMGKINAASFPHPQATPDMDPPPLSVHVWHATVLQSRRRRRRSSFTGTTWKPFYLFVHFDVEAVRHFVVLNRSKITTITNQIQS